MSLPTLEGLMRRERHTARTEPIISHETPVEEAVAIKRRRKLRTRKLNENFKLFASALNSLSLAIGGAVTIVPYFGQRTVPDTWFWIIVAIGLHGGAHAILQLALRSED